MSSRVTFHSSYPHTKKKKYRHQSANTFETMIRPMPFSWPPPNKTYGIFPYGTLITFCLSSFARFEAQLIHILVSALCFSFASFWVRQPNLSPLYLIRFPNRKLYDVGRIGVRFFFLSLGEIFQSSGLINPI